MLEQSRIVELRFFAGLTIEDTSEVLGISPATVKRDWVTARAWLFRAMTRRSSGMSADRNAERWERVKHLFDETIGLDTSERRSYLDRVCAGEPEFDAWKWKLSSPRANSLPKWPAAISRKPLRSTPPPETPSTHGSAAGSATINWSEKLAAAEWETSIGRFAPMDNSKKKLPSSWCAAAGTPTFALERFRIERQILAGLDQPNIARLLDGGTTDDGLPYLVMELVAGVPIDQYCDDKKLNITQRLRLFLQVCGAVQYAHQRLVIHRDIKPNNILVAEDGTPKLLDFGIAKLLDPAAGTQATAMQAMTPEYASPEQIRGETITTSSDVYSLGVLLYQLLTGRSPHAGDTRSPHGLALAICDKEPPDAKCPGAGN